jgi:hypothetical protein
MDERLSFITTNNLQYLLLYNKNVINSALCHLGNKYGPLEMGTL